MHREHLELPAPGLPHPGTMLRFGHAGRPVLAFPTQNGRAWEWEDNGMIGAIADLIDGGAVTLYCVDTFDAHTWSDFSVPGEERARRYRDVHRWLVEAVVPAIAHRTPGDLLATGASLGAYHALQFAITRADIAPNVLGLSGNYDPASWNAWGEHGEFLWWANPTRYLDSFDGDHLAWLRSRLSVQLVVGQGDFETDTGALPSSRAMAQVLGRHRIGNHLDLWGGDVAHHWYWWQRQLAVHLHRWCGSRG